MDTQKRPRLEITDRQGNRIVSESFTGEAGIARLQGRELTANRGTSLNLDWVESVRVNLSAVERRAASLGTRRTVKKDWQIAWLHVDPFWNSIRLHPGFRNLQAQVALPRNFLAFRGSSS